MRTIRRILAFLLFLVLVAFVTAFYFIRNSFPQVSGELRLSGLKEPVEVIRDAEGVPHIYARNQQDLFFAQGYVHAQDRFWQMDFWRHLGSGRLSELFGSSVLETDRFLRTLGWARVVKTELQQIDANSLAILKAYAAGVNAYLATHQGSELGLEYVLLKTRNRGYKPEPWEPLHSLTWAKAMAWDLRDNIDHEIRRSLLLRTFSREKIDQLYPPYPPDHPYIVQGNEVVAPQPYSPPVEVPLEELASNMTRLDALLGKGGTGIGSNNWVISGKRTMTGKPLLANDPHLSAQMPSIWYEVGLHCEPKSPDCDYNVTGFSFAGDPGVVIGHNDRIAWAFTNVGPDVMDLYVEKINPQNPNQYEVNGSWVNMQLVNETIRVAGENPVPITIRYTRHGPVLTDAWQRMKDFRNRSGIEMPEHYAISLRWTALEFSNTFRALWRLNRAQNWNEFRGAASDFAVPSQNWIYADVDGNIGYQTPGRIPIRAVGDGRYPVPGWTDENEWTGTIPFDELPREFNPARGYIASANNSVIQQYPYLITHDWDHGYRARRIVDMIEQQRQPFTIADVARMQGDNKNLIAEILVPILKVVNPQDAKHFDGWDFQSSMDSSAAALFEVFWMRLLMATFEGDLPGSVPVSGDSRWFEVVRRIVKDPENPWWDNSQTPAKETRDSILREALHNAVSELQQRFGNDPSTWRWGALHTVTFRNETFGNSGSVWIDRMFNRGPFECSGGSSIVNATGWDATESYEVDTLPSMRMIVDLSDLDRSLAIQTTGQSGHAFHPHYINMANRWRRIEYHPMLWDKSRIRDSASAILRLSPQ